MPELVEFAIDDGLKPGQVITIQGKIPDNVEQWWIRIYGGDVILLTIGIRSDEDRVIRNSNNGEWGDEDSCDPCPFKPGDSFDAQIRVLEDGYKIAFDGDVYCNFDHREDISSATHIRVNDVQVTNISVEGRSSLPEEYFSETRSDFSTGSRASVTGIKTPYHANIPGGLKPGTLIQLVGTPTDEGNDKWLFRLQTDIGSKDAGEPVEDIGLSFACRWDEDAIIMNSRKRGDWGDEERGFMVFEKGTKFDLACLVTDDGYKISVNNGHIANFSHNVRMKHVDVIFIYGDVKIANLFIHE
ncbi:PREDICTED: 32 kDa beta-galactoside-binding lectin-like [Priapulus caudatus]|uniref:Galectin n=1 Tax=Priapulus caudatus TaxID=37621 RepID=A0ABM1ESY2_PRICU|nr:PREDICTED: 32 kDa beta-galactoside-binding lectin-like [Priapulus caudatus]